MNELLDRLRECLRGDLTDADIFWAFTCGICICLMALV